MPYAKIDASNEIYYEVKGDGEPLVLIMGTGADRLAWAFQTPFFASQGYQVITPDNRGVGLTKTNTKTEDYSVVLLAEDVIRVLDDAGVQRAHVGGMSLGSAIAQEIALRHPDRVASLQLHVTWAKSDHFLQYVFKNFQLLVDKADPQTLLEVATVWACSPALIADDALRNQWFAMRMANPNPPSREGHLGQWHADKNHDTLDRLPKIACPTLVTAGEIDALVPARYARQVADAIPGAVFHLFTGPRSSHLNCIEMPEEFNRVCLEFLKKHPMPQGAMAAASGARARAEPELG